MNDLNEYFSSSIGKKQIVAVTGLLLIGFVLTHLAGNLLIYLGPDAFNGYAKKLESFGILLKAAEITLTIIFLIHIFVTTLLVLQNISARPVGYRVFKDSGDRSLATRLMPYTGTFLILFLVGHLLDFTLVDKHTYRNILPDGKNYGLFGVVYNAFANPVHSLLYIAAMGCLGLHLAHGIESFFQTFGLNKGPFVKPSRYIALIIAIAYSSIPVYVYATYPLFVHH